jgi:biofilm protein TabA
MEAAGCRDDLNRQSIFFTHKFFFMIIDTIQNAPKYFSLHAFFPKAFEYIRNTDLETMESGKYDILGEGLQEDDLKAIFSTKKGMTAEESIAKFECHEKFIDIQVCINGVEQIGWKPKQKCATPNGGYNEEKDVRLFKDAPDMYFQLTNGQFVIFFPEDVHAPMIGDSEIKKLVIKVKI